MLRLDPGEGRVRTAREFKVWEGGGEYNVARGLRRCFGLRTAVATAFADNDVGRLLEDFILQGGVATEFIKWIPFDGVGRTVRNGLNFTERGFGIRGAVGVSDRGLTAASQLKAGDFNWDEIFGKLGVRWLHTGGIFAALSDTTPKLVIEAVQAAKKHGTIVSYDLNYRPSLWQSIGGQKRAQEVNREVARHVDVMIGNEEDFTACLGFDVDGVDEHISKIDVTAFMEMIQKAVKAFTNFKVTATTLRAVKSATYNATRECHLLIPAGEVYRSQDPGKISKSWTCVGHTSTVSPAGLIYGFMQYNDPQKAVEYGAAHGALAHDPPPATPAWRR